MVDQARRDFLELELQAVQRLYDGEKARRETVRTSLAIPFAAVALIVLSMTALLRFVLETSGGDWSRLAVVVVGLIMVSGVLLIVALIYVARIDYAAIEAEGPYLDLSKQRSELEDALRLVHDDAGQRQSEAERLAISAAIYAYDQAIDGLRRSNDGNLQHQAVCLRLLVGCVAAIAGAIILALTNYGLADHHRNRLDGDERPAVIGGGAGEDPGRPEGDHAGTDDFRHQDTGPVP